MLFHRALWAAALCCVLAIPCAEARPRDPVGQLFAGIGKAFEPPTKSRTKSTRYSAKSKKHVAAKAYRRTKLSHNVPAITVHPEPKAANASGLTVLPDKTALRDLTEMYARQHGIDPALAVALIQVESQFDPWAVGGAGEIGLGQLKIGTAIDLGYTGSVRGLYHVGTNLRLSMAYLAKAKAKSDGTVCGMLSRYNAGLYSNGRRQGYCNRVTAAMN